MDDDRTLPVDPDDDHTLPLDGPGAGASDEDIGTVIGPYRLVRRIGEGGMGEVFEAEQTEPLRRRVALKVIKQGMDTRRVIARFDAERQALALMDHPCIARVFDAGATALGRPFFVMEYVEGEPITRYCNRKRLGTAARLKLFAQVCDGVQHAHQKAIIHRDLKPGNILVTEVDGQPVPKIIDFGLAKATDHQLTGMTMFTEQGMMLGTPEYMSPEQAADDEIDTRTDIYALGVVLYVMLAGALPFESKELRQAGYDAVRRIIREQDPPRPSTRFSNLGEQATVVAEARGIAPRRLQSELQGDLDWITMKALEKERARRYETANAFAMDVRRFLDHEPVLASPPSAGYRLGKLVRRNRGAFAALGAIAAVLVAATVVSSVMYVRAERASEVARREAVRAGQVSQFLGEMLGGVGPQKAQGRDTEMLRAILDDTSERLGKELADQPDVEATLRLQLGDTYRQLGEYEAAQEQVDRAIELQDRFGMDTPGAFEVQLAAGNLAWNREDLRLAETHFRRCRELAAGTTSQDSLNLAEATVYLGNVMGEQGAYAEGDSLLRLSLAIYRTQPTEGDFVAVNLNSLGNMSRYLGDNQAAEDYYREALAIHRRVWGDDHPFVATDMHNLARLLEAMGQSAEGTELLLEALALQRRLYTGPHPDIGQTLMALSEFARADTRWVEADSLARAAHDIMVSFYGPTAEPSLRCLIALADVKESSGSPAEAEAIIREVVTLARSPECDDRGMLPNSLYRLASAQAAQNRTREALVTYAEALEVSTVVNGEDHPNALLIRNDYARALTKLGEYETAVQQLRAVLAARERVLGESHPQTAITRLDLGRGLWRLDQLEEAEQSMRRARTDYGAAMGENHRGCWHVTQNLAGVLRDLGRCDDAESELLPAVDYWRSLGPSSDRFVRLTQARLATVWLRAGRTAEAERLLSEALTDSTGRIDPWIESRALSDRGEAELNMGQPAAAVRSLQQSLEIRNAGPDANADENQALILLLAKACDRSGRTAEAAAWRAKLQ